MWVQVRGLFLVHLFYFAPPLATFARELSHASSLDFLSAAASGGANPVHLEPHLNPRVQSHDRTEPNLHLRFRFEVQAKVPEPAPNRTPFSYDKPRKDLMNISSNYGRNNRNCVRLLEVDLY
ncbi:uncharacterized protein EV420DRAFT_1480597 [Desarmillaria tabescens]|uniref:Secreted protein n=1 Tax=Armillaria tabescens TaxID=1929756 RepID=A0AA39KCN8_ARMTA|nr:uncharacterized protein EV420DRAFT_1480597 [Desarmillaria tabescens]KAK0457530.1 hypothetical protein EV420DRAFT_1480597 [Desarmillaria tabescens]